MDITHAVTVTTQDLNSAIIFGTVLPPGRYKGTGMTFKSAILLCLEKDSIFLLPYDTTNVVHVKIEQQIFIDVLDGDLIWLTARQAPNGEVKIELNRGDSIPADGLHVATQGALSVTNEDIIDFLGLNEVINTIYSADDSIADPARVVTVPGTLEFIQSTAEFRLLATQTILERISGNYTNRITISQDASGITLDHILSSPLTRPRLVLSDVGMAATLINCYLTLNEIPSYDDDAAAGAGGVPSKGVWQTSATNTLGLPQHVLMIRA